MGNINYRTLNDLNSSTIKNMHKIPSSVDLIVAIPRSGLLLGNIIALYLNKPITTVEMFLRGEIIEHGTTRYIENNGEFKHLLIVDDTSNTGNSILTAKHKLLDINASKTYLCAYVNNRSKRFVDIFFEVIEHPRIFQWNIMHSWFNKKSVYDLDGVLCENPKVDDDGPLYVKEIENAKPKFIPYETIDIICSCRLEKYREITEKWLRDNKVKYNSLCLMDYATKAERLRDGKHGEYKGKVFRDSKCDTFFESDFNQAKTIKSMNPNKNVFCVDNMTFV